MDSTNSLDEVNLIAALLSDVSSTSGAVFDMQACSLTIRKVRKRVSTEGLSFLTKTLPRLAKGLDKALCEGYLKREYWQGFQSYQSSELPRFLGEFFQTIFDSQGKLLQHPNAKSVLVLRQVLYLFYKYELPYSSDLEQSVVRKFERTEDEVRANSRHLHNLHLIVNNYTSMGWAVKRSSYYGVIQGARELLSELFSDFDPKDIIPRHGPGAVATRQKLWDKFLWTNVCSRITDLYPFDEFFCSSMGHVCDSYPSFSGITDHDLPARVILVPKDSRGPRLISCEPVDFQWVQQGLSNAIVRHVERHYLTRDNVFFTRQQPNRFAALWGSESGKYATLDLNEASDRVSVGLVRLLFPDNVYTYLEGCRSRSTELPCGKVLALDKYAPMGSALCFPVMALTIWAILTASVSDANTRESIYVYGDDVIVPTPMARNAIERLESFGLKINHDKSCTSGFFRESCGMDAFQGIDVTPVRLRTVWSSEPSPEVYTSWISYANSFYDKQFFRTYDYIVSKLLVVYKQIPGEERCLSAPSLRVEPVDQPELRARTNPRLQKREYRVWTTKSPTIRKTINGWSMLLRYFTEFGAGKRNMVVSGRKLRDQPLPQLSEEDGRSSVSQYTARSTSMLVRRWR